MRGVVRIEIHQPKKTRGWQARLYCGRKAVTRFFSDSLHGGKEEAYLAACAAREQMEAGLPLPPKPKRANTSAQPL